jgi:hypothetical protein
VVVVSRVRGLPELLAGGRGVQAAERARGVDDVAEPVELRVRRGREFGFAMYTKCVPASSRCDVAVVIVGAVADSQRQP